MPLNNREDKVVEDWLSASAEDLESARVLHDNKLFAPCLYHLQQSNEKLAKALLMAIGILTPKRATKDWTTKSVLGFFPKEPSSYRHRTLPSLLSDIEKSIPSIEDFVTLLEKSRWPQITEVRESIQTSKRTVKKLKKKSLIPVVTAEQVKNEIKDVQAILDALEPAQDRMKKELEKLDPKETLKVATLVARKAGFRVDISQHLSLDEIKSRALWMFPLSTLTTLSVALASFLDPLVSVTRYPDSRHVSFDENHPIAKNFNGLYDVIARCLEKSHIIIASQSARAENSFVGRR